MILLRHGKRAIAILICISLLMSVIPASTSAKDISSTETAVAVGAEIVSMREENVKHYDMGNGTFQAIAYSHPVHEKDSQGNWQDIDFGMTLTQTRGIGTYKTDSGAAFRQNYVAGQPIMTLSDDDTAIAMTLVTNTNTQTMSTQAMQSATPIAASLTESKADLGTFASAQTATFSNTLFYENVLTGVDLEYIVDPWTVKENIIVKQPAVQYVYNFKLDLEGLYPVLQADGSVLIYNAETDEPEYEIPAPYMYDSIGEMSFDVAYTLSGENGVYYFTVTADSSWVNAPERVFPITIDPSYATYTSITHDTYINGSDPGSTRGTNNFFYVGENEVAYIRSTLPTLPSGTSLQKAELHLCYFYKSGITSGHVDMTAHRVTGFDWDENSLTWNMVVNSGASNFGLSAEILNSNDDNNGVISLGAGSAFPSSPKPVSILITEVVQAWINNNAANYGIGLRYKANSSPNRSIMFRSSEGPAEYRPQVIYSYRQVSTPSSFLYRHFYDESMEDQVGHISGAVNAANIAFTNQFGISFNTIGSPVFNDDLFDSSATCKNIVSIASNIYDERVYANEIAVLWTNHDANYFCNHNNPLSQCLPETALACVVDYNPAIHFLRLPIKTHSADECTAAMAIILIHETAHAFGCDESRGTGHDADGWVCVMEYYEPDLDTDPNADTSIATQFYYDIINQKQPAFCNTCQSNFRSEIQDGFGN